MKKQIIRLTESDIHKIVKESIKRILKEDSLFDNHISSNIFDDMIKRGLYKRLQPKQFKDFIMNGYGLSSNQESIADNVAKKLVVYKQRMEEEYGLTEANWSNALTDPGDYDPFHDDEYEWTDNDEVDLQHDYEKERKLRNL